MCQSRRKRHGLCESVFERRRGFCVSVSVRRGLHVSVLLKEAWPPCVSLSIGGVASACPSTSCQMLSMYL